MLKKLFSNHKECNAEQYRLRLALEERDYKIQTLVQDLYVYQEEIRKLREELDKTIWELGETTKLLEAVSAKKSRKKSTVSDSDSDKVECN